VDLHPNDQHIIVSGDTDFTQLLSDNVKIYDGVKGHVISLDGVFDDKGKPIVHKKTKLKTVNGKKVKEQELVPASIPNPKYELFKKIVRGDTSDNIMSAYPGVRENGTRDKIGIKAAFEDRDSKGFNWNNFMLQTWIDIDGNSVRVLDKYNLNKTLIDLRAQPEDIKQKMDAAIMTAVEKKPISQVGIWFLRFCEENGLVNVSKFPQQYSCFLSEPYLK